MLEWLESNFSEVGPLSFYRDLFPVGALDKRGVFTKGKYTALCVQLDGTKPLKHTLTDELDNLEELLSSELFTIISPLSYAGKSMKAENQREIFALAIDLDNTLFKKGRSVGMENLFSQIDRAKLIPRPTYIVASSGSNSRKRNVHLYYLFEEPIKAFAHNKETLANYKTWLTKLLWNKYITKDYDKAQLEPIGQGMRAVGSVCKDSKDGRVRAFLCGDKVSIEYLNSFAPDSAKIDTTYTPRDKDKLEKKPRKGWIANEALYEWWLREMRKGAVVGRRYFCCMCAAIFAQKSGISRERLEQDILSMTDYLDSLGTTDDERFSPDEALKACSAFDNPRYLFMRRETLERLSGITIPKSKRNYRKQALHLKLARANLAILNEESGKALQGRPTKRELVLGFARLHPDYSNRKIALELGISKDTVNKWMKANSND